VKIEGKISFGFANKQSIAIGGKESKQEVITEQINVKAGATQQSNRDERVLTTTGISIRNCYFSNNNLLSCSENNTIILQKSGTALHRTAGLGTYRCTQPGQATGNWRQGISVCPQTVM